MDFIGAANALCDAWSTGFETISTEAGTAVKKFRPFHGRAGRMGRALNPPPQFGHTLSSISSTHVRQNVHSKEQILASRELGNKRTPQFSQVGRISSMDCLSGSYGPNYAPGWDF
jgi:hypothetical protein